MNCITLIRSEGYFVHVMILMIPSITICDWILVRRSLSPRSCVKGLTDRDWHRDENKWYCQTRISGEWYTVRDLIPDM